MNAPRGLVVHPDFNVLGGGTCVAAWALQALQDEFALDILTWTPPDFSVLNRSYGTTLDAKKFKTFSAPAPLRALFALDPDPWSFQSVAWMMRWAKWIRRAYAFVFALCNEVEFGAPCIQYVNFPYLRRIAQQERALAAQSEWRAFLFQLRVWRIVSGFSFERMKKNLTLVNSEWGAAQFTRVYNAPARTLYPPVSGNFPPVAWAERENGFVCLGRLVREKRYDAIIAILDQVRTRGADLHLHIVGAQMDSRYYDSNYGAELRALARQHAAWVTLHENLARTELEYLLAHHRYGIHAMPNEHFGIAPAEMMRAGCIVFVPNSGGQVEIVGEEPRVRFDSDADAVEKIARVLDDARAQAELRTVLHARANLFTPERFMREMRAVVKEHLYAAD